MGYIDLPEFAGPAQEFVEATSPLVSGRTINIMNLDGIILASTEKGRIGTYHHGAKIAAETGKPVLITRQNLDQYPGAREGYNLPIMEDGRIIGVVGLYGEEKETADAANLLRVYVTQFLKQQIKYREEAFENELRGELLNLYLLGSDEKRDEISQLMNTLSLHLEFPMVLMAVTFFSRRPDPKELQRLAGEMGRGTRTGARIRDGVLFAIRDNSVMLLHSTGRAWQQAAAEGGVLTEGLARSDAFLKDILALVEAREGLRLSVSHICRTLGEMPEAYREVLALRKGPNRMAWAENSRDRFRYFLSRLATHGGRAYVQREREKLLKLLDWNQLVFLLETARSYYEMDGSVQKASARLNIHKNTLQYRMRRLYEYLGMEKDPPFEREFCIRMLIAEFLEQGTSL